MISRIFMTKTHGPVPEDNFLTCDDKNSDTEEMEPILGSQNYSFSRVHTLLNKISVGP